MKFYLYSDNHGSFGQIAEQRRLLSLRGPDCALIILGDVGVNYSGDERDNQVKDILNSLGFKIYCLRGNHEMRPEHVPTMHKIFDSDVEGPVWIEDRFQNIRYFTEHNPYYINGMKTIVLQGAYSIDKWYRISNGYKWFGDEQMSNAEMREAEKVFLDGGCDMVLSHTCPLQYQPTELFLSFVDQSTVDNTMEKWMGKCAEKYRWKYWFFGHYHADMKITDGVYMLHHIMRPLNEVLLLAGEHNG